MKIDLAKFDFESDKIFQALGQDEKRVFLSAGENLFFKKGRLIFYEGGIPTGVFYLKGGKAKVYKTGLDGKDQIFYVYKAGDLLGYHALLCHETYEDSCETLEDCELIFISTPKFEKLIEELTELKHLLIQNMSHEFGVLVNIITVLAQKPLRERLALFLLVLDTRYHQAAIELPRDDLANIVGTARESLSRLLREFKDANLIKIQSRSIKLQDRVGLLRIASSKYK